MYKYTLYFFLGMKKILFPCFILLSWLSFAQLPSPVFHAPLNGSVVDISPNPLVSTATVGGFDIGKCGEVNSSFLVNASNNGGLRYNNAAKLNITSEITMMAWINLTTLSNSFPRLETEVISKDSYNFGFNDNGSTTSVGLDFEANPNSRNTIGSIVIATWTHIAVTYKASDNLVKYYVNGTTIGGYATSSLMSINSNPLVIGGYSTANEYQFPGKIQDVRIYNQKLSDEQISQIYNSFSVNGPILTTACGASAAIMSVQTLSGSAYTFQWYKDETILAGETNSSISLNPASASAGSVFSVTGTSSCGSFTTVGAALIVPTITGIAIYGNVLSVCPNVSLTVSASATGSNLSYKWFKDGVLITSTTNGNVFKNFNTATLSVTGFPNSLNGIALDFSCQISNSCETVNSSNFNVFVNNLPTITGFSGALSGCSGTSTTIDGFTNFATSYQWLRNGTVLNALTEGGIYGDSFSTTGLNISGLPFINLSTVVSYNLSATGICGGTSNFVNLTINGITSISGPLLSTNYCVGNSKTFILNTVSGLNLSYSWGMWDNLQTTFTPISNGLEPGIGTINGINARILTISGLQANISNVFIATISGSCSTFISSTAGLNYQQNITATSFSGITACTNDNVIFSTTVSGAGPYNYQWFKNGSNFGTNASSITLSNVNGGDNGDLYRVSVSGFCNSITTPSAMISISNNSSVISPSNTTICAGSIGNMVLTVTSSNPIYQWYKNNTIINELTDNGVYGTSFTTLGLSFSNVPSSISGSSYKCTIKGDCGAIITTSGILLTVANLPNIALQPSSTFGTCVGLNASVEISASGANLIYQWQYFNTSTSLWANVTSLLGSFTGINSNKLNAFKLNITSNGLNFRNIINNFCNVAQTTSLTSLITNSGPEVNFFGWKPSLCENGNPETVQAFTDLSLPFSSVSGTFTYLSGSANVSNTGFNTAEIEPYIATGTNNFNVLYTSAPNNIGCAFTTTLTSIINTVSGFGLSWLSPDETANSFSMDDTNPIPLSITITSGIVGTTTFSNTFLGMNQSGIVGNQFYPSLIAPKPNIVNNEKIVYLYSKFTSESTGCSDTITRKINVFFPQNFYTFSPQSPLVDKSSFCATDNTVRTVTMVLPVFDNSRRCTKSIELKITPSNISAFNGISTFDFSTNKIRFDIDSYTFVGSNLTPGGYNLEYVYDFNSTSINNTCSTLLSRATNSTYRQEIRIFPIPDRPKIKDYLKCEANVSLSDVIVATASNQSIEWYTTTSTSSIISGLTGQTSVSLLQLGITSTGFATYKRYARQFQNGCPGALQDIDIEIRQTPLPPKIITSLPTTGGCANDITTGFVVSITSNTIGATSNLNGWQSPIINILSGANIIGGISYNMNFKSALATIVTISGNSNLASCSSPTTFFNLTINSIPLAGTLSGANNRCMDYDGIFRASPVEIAVNSTMPISFEGTYMLNYPTNSGAIAMSNITFNGTQSKSFVTSNLNKTQIGFTDFYIYTENTITGCRSNDFARFNTNSQFYNVNPKPQPPFQFTFDVFCNSSNYGIISTSGTDLKWYSNTNATSLIGTGNALNLATCLDCMPLNRYLKPAIIDTLYYVTQTVNGCESSVTGIEFKMFAPFKPLPIFTTDPGSAFGIQLTKTDQICTNQDPGEIRVRNRGSQPLPGFNASRNFNFFTQYYSVLGGEIMTLGTPLNHSLAGQFPFYVQENVVSEKGKYCFAPTTLTSGIITINETPSPPIVRDTAFCLPGLIGNLLAKSTIMGSNMPSFKWYSNQNLLLGTSDSNTNVSVSGSTLTGIYQSDFATSLTVQTVSSRVINTYFVSQTVKGCESKPNLAITRLNLFPTPNKPTFKINNNFICSGETVPTLEVLNSTGRIVWYDNTNFNSIIGANLDKFTPNISNILAWTGTSTSKITYIYSVTDLVSNISTSSLNFVGCKSDFVSDTITIRANPPLVNSNLLEKICVNTDSRFIENLTATGVNGINQDLIWYDFSTGIFENKISQNIQNIDVSKSGIFKYGVSDEYLGCEGPQTVITVTVLDLPIPSISNINTIFCEYETPLTITGTSNSALTDAYFEISALLFPNTVPSGMLSSISGNNSKAKFDPSKKDVLQSQSYNITYTVKDNNNCSNTTFKKVDVFAKTVQDFSFDGISSETVHSVCGNNAKIVLRGGNLGGSFATTRIGIVGSDFFPAAVISSSPEIDTVSIKYTYTDQNGCFNRTEKLIYVFPNPTAKFRMSSHCVGNIDLIGMSTIPFKNKSQINEFLWAINGQTFNQDKNSGLSADAPSSYRFYYSVKESSFGCQDAIEVDSIVDAYPIVDFNWKNICFGDSTQFFDNSRIPVGGGTLESLVWSLGSNTILGGNQFGKSFKLKFNTDTIQNITLEAQTTEKCLTRVTKKVQILPTITKFPYEQNFETNQGSWFTEGLNTSWEWGASTLLGNSKIWATNLNGNHNPNERSFLNGPCFNLDSLSRPMIKLDLNYRTNSAIDGSILQFSTDGGTVWQPLEDFRTGINWYNTRNIVNDPGDQNNFLTPILNDPIKATYVGSYARQMGWNGNSLGWKTSRNTLDEPKRQVNGQNKNVRIRLAFATAGSSQADGQALDNIWIGPRTKTVLLENFVNTQSPASNSTQTNTLDNFILNNKDDVVGINYHTSFPSIDIFNASNPSDPSTRVLYYGVENIPRTALDGEMVAGSSSTLGLNTLKDKSLVNPIFEVRGAKSNLSNTFIVSAEFTATEDIIDNSEFIAHCVVIEKTIKNVSGLTKPYYNVIKKMLPSAAGTSFEGNWLKNQSRSIQLSWNYTGNTDIFNKDSLGVVIFIQNRVTKQVIQSAYYGPSQSSLALPPLAVMDIEKEETTGIQVFPNPAQNQISITYPKLTKNLAWQLFDIAGRLVQNGFLLADSQTITTDISDLPNGIYQLKTGTKFTKIVISK